MRYIDGREYATVSEVAEAAGVSAQTVRLWEQQGVVAGRRSRGGHRLFDKAAVRVVVEHAARLRREERQGRAAYPAQPDVRVAEFASTGARIRAARDQRGLTQQAIAARAGISRSLLSAVERGESGISVKVFNRIAEALDIPMSDLAPVSNDKKVTRAADRPTTVMADGVRWEELASSGHSMAPALLIVPPGASSGGIVNLSRENFVTILAGELTFDLSGPQDRYALAEGDSIVLMPGEAHRWSNTGDAEAKAVWVEHLSR